MKSHNWFLVFALMLCCTGLLAMNGCDKKDPDKAFEYASDIQYIRTPEGLVFAVIANGDRRENALTFIPQSEVEKIPAHLIIDMKTHKPRDHP